MLYLSFVSGSLIYITTSESAESPCPAEPCVTLSQLAINLTQYLNDNMTMIFLRGNHSLDRKLLFTNVTTVTATVTALSRSHSASENILIECALQYANFVFSKIEFVHISNLYFMGCNHKFESVGELTVELASFQGYKYTGSAVELIDTTSAYIQTSTFSYNTNGNYLGPIGIFVYTRNHYPDVLHNISTYTNVGGALIVTQSELTIIDCIFEKNKAIVGGAIFSWRNSNVTIVNSTFSDNFATLNNSACYGGAIYIESDNYHKSGLLKQQEIIMIIHNTTFFHNSACHQGGAISGFYSNIRIKSSHGFQNMAINGGVIGAVKTAISIEDSNFELNVAFSGHGGVLAASYESILGITSSTFMLNTADLGGVISAELGSSCTIFKCL